MGIFKGRSRRNSQEHRAHGARRHCKDHRREPRVLSCALALFIYPLSQRTFPESSLSRGSWDTAIRSAVI